MTEQSTAINPATGLPYAPRANYVYRGRRDRQPQLRQPEQLARLGVVRHRVARDEGRLPGRVHPRQELVPRSTSRSCPTGSTRACRTSSRSGCRSGTSRTARRTAALYVQDKWTRGRLTLQGALRYDRAWSFTPGGAQRDGADVDSSTRRRLRFERTPGVDAFNDITPRIGVAYDVFGNGKTALKFNLGHYLDAATNDSEYTSNSPAARIVRTATRNWARTPNRQQGHRLRHHELRRRTASAPR